MQLREVEVHEMNGYTNKKENGKRYDKDEKKQYEYGKYMKPHVWEIYFADLPEVEDSHILCGLRPVIVFSNDICNSTSTEINVYPLTKRIRNWIPTHVTICKNKVNGLKRNSQVYCEQGRTIPKRNLLEYWGQVTNLSLQLKIVHAIMIQNGMLSYMNVAAS